VSAVIIAQPETVARLLMSDDLEVARFADTCLVINLADSAPGSSNDTPGNEISSWQQTVARLVKTPTDHAIVRMDSQAMAIMDDFRQEVAIALKDGRGDQNRYLLQLSVIASKIALGLWAGWENPFGSITAEQARQAIEVAKMNVHSREAILAKWTGDWTRTELEKLCELALQKITQHGPISGRGLSRRCHRKNLGQLQPALDHLIKTGKITEGADDKYDLRERSLPELQVVEAG